MAQALAEQEAHINWFRERCPKLPTSSEMPDLFFIFFVHTLAGYYGLFPRDPKMVPSAPTVFPSNNNIQGKKKVQLTLSFSLTLRKKYFPEASQAGQLSLIG